MCSFGSPPGAWACSTAVRRLEKLVKDGRLIEVEKGTWDKKTNKPGPASVYDLPESQANKCSRTTAT